MFFLWLLLKVKFFILGILNGFRRALCCIRKRRHSYGDTAPLTHVVSSADSDAPVWSEWSDDSFLDKPKTVQDYIEMYRQQKVIAQKALKEEQQDEDADTNLFEDMAPRIMKQSKVLVKTNFPNQNHHNNRLNVTDIDSINVVSSGELGEWDENSGWDGEQLLDHEAQKVLREQKRLERERKVLEQHQKRVEKTSKTLGSKVAA